MEAEEYKITIPAHPSVYDPKPRELDVYFCVPGAGVNSETGLLIFIPGFGANAESKVYKKMRKLFADKHNLVTIQCNYFGYEFMQGSKDVSVHLDLEVSKKIFGEEQLGQIYRDGKIDFDKLMNIGKNYNVLLEGEEILSESPENFNDMGVMQAVDCLTAILVVMEIIKDNGFNFNKGKIITYGHSHGSFLAYLCNAFCPHLINLIIDNSAWLWPRYLTAKRVERFTAGLLKMKVRFYYLASRVSMNMEIVNLGYLYKVFQNNAQIICYQGSSDNFINPAEKRKFVAGLKNAVYIEVNKSMVDGKKFYSEGHGLNADFLELLDYSLSNFPLSFINRPDIPLPDVVVQTTRNRYQFSYGTGVPFLNVSGPGNVTDFKELVKLRRFIND